VNQYFAVMMMFDPGKKLIDSSKWLVEHGNQMRYSLHNTHKSFLVLPFLLLSFSSVDPPSYVKSLIILSLILYQSWQAKTQQKNTPWLLHWSEQWCNISFPNP
jgi:hypothetical protein